MARALSIAETTASSLTAVLVQGAWTKRLDSRGVGERGLRAAVLGRQRAFGPRTRVAGPVCRGACAAGGSIDRGGAGVAYTEPPERAHKTFYPNTSPVWNGVLFAVWQGLVECEAHASGGAREPLFRGDIEEKFVLNA